MQDSFFKRQSSGNAPLLKVQSGKAKELFGAEDAIQIYMRRAHPFGAPPSINFKSARKSSKLASSIGGGDTDSLALSGDMSNLSKFRRKIGATSSNHQQ